jgi:gustatory receptor
MNLPNMRKEKRRITGEESLEMILNFGKILALTPPYNPELTLFRKIYSTVVLAVITVGVIISTINKRLYRNFISIKIAEHFVLDGSLLIFNYCSITAVTFWKRRQWKELVENLKIIADAEIWSSVVVFIALQFLGVLTLTFALYTRIDMYGFEYVSRYNVDYLQDYMLYSYNTILYVIARMIFINYKLINKFLWQILHRTGDCETNCHLKLKQIETHLYLLKDTVDIFNDIFGWPIFFIIVYTTLHILNHFDNIFAASLFPDSEPNPTVKIVIDIGILLLTFVSNKKSGFINMIYLKVGTTTMIVTCDSIVMEAESILSMFLKLQRYSDGDLRRKQKFYLGSRVVLENFPKFSAARFFNISRTTILSILGSVTNYFIIMIQFYRT